MYGPSIFARSISEAGVVDRYGNHWQYHPRSDRHSKIGCWALLFDLLQHCPHLIRHIEAGKVNFGINHEMRDFKTGRKKDLDLVICTPMAASGGWKPVTFEDLARAYKIKLDTKEALILSSLPELHSVPVGSVHVAMEAKAAMTAHIRALPRLYDELNSSHLAIHGAADFAIAAGFVVVNLATSFISPDKNRRRMRGKNPVINKHKQPQDTERTVAKVRELPRRTHGGIEGFDAIGLLVIEMLNDGSPARLVTKPPAPGGSDVLNYEQMVLRVASLYATKFSGV